jgi:hypothetical protein
VLRIKPATFFIAVLSGLCTQAHATESSNWQVTQGVDKLSQKSMCLLESASQSVDDGRTTTPMRIVYNGKAFLVLTRAKIDLTYPQVGLHVDKKSVLAIDRVYKETAAVFETDADKIREQFIKGRVAYIALGFWPTWPKSHTVVAHFSLIGFHAAYADYVACLNTHPATH